MKEVNHKKDKELLINLCEAISVSKNNIRKDELGYWIIQGKKGFIDTDGKYAYLHLSAETALKWKNIKTSLPEAQIHIDCECEGVLRLPTYPDEFLSNKIRRFIGVRWAKKYTLEEVEALVSRLNKK